MRAFAAAVDLLFEDPNLALDALYRVGADDPGRMVRVIRKAPDEVASFGASRVAGATTLLDIRTREVALPGKGDLVTIDGVLHIVQGSPRRDRERLVWIIEARPDE